MSKNVLITGSSKGIGLATAKYFAQDFNVYITGRHATILEKLCSENNFKGFFAVDLTQNNAVETLINALNVDIDILINNAGAYIYNSIEKTDNENIEKLIKLNMFAPYKLIKSVIPTMKQKQWGRIINIGSISGVMGEAYASLYSMTKAALIGLTKALALETAQNGITVNIINPGWVDTELINDENLEQDFTKEEIIETIPQRRFVKPEEIAAACDFLVKNSAVTGQSINICAGLSLGF